MLTAIRKALCSPTSNYLLQKYFHHFRIKMLATFFFNMLKRFFPAPDYAVGNNRRLFLRHYPELPLNCFTLPDCYNSIKRNQTSVAYLCYFSRRCFLSSYMAVSALL